MKYRQGFLLYIAAFFLKPFMQDLFPEFGKNLKILLCLTVVLTFLYDETLPGILCGFVFGLLHDIVFGIYIGPGVTALVVTGIAVLVLREFVNIENFFNALITMLFSTWLYTSVYWGIYFVLGSPYSYGYAMKTVPWQLLFNCLVAAVLYLPLIKRVKKHRRDRYFK